MKKSCNSCKKVLVNAQGSTSFMCPNCSKYEINRCAYCRKLAAKYSCPECNFEGPN